MNRGKTTEAFTPADFLPTWDEEEQEDPSDEQLLGMVRGIHAGLGGRRFEDHESEGDPPRQP